MLNKHNATDGDYNEHFKHGLKERMILEEASQEKLWTELNKINMSKFYEDTAPQFSIKECMMNNVDCTYAWEFEQTYLGIVSL